MAQQPGKEDRSRRLFAATRQRREGRELTGEEWPDYPLWPDPGALFNWAAMHDETDPWRGCAAAVSVAVRIARWSSVRLVPM
jgi:hypothetical protein